MLVKPFSTASTQRIKQADLRISYVSSSAGLRWRRTWSMSRMQGPKFKKRLSTC